MTMRNLLSVATLGALSSFGASADVALAGTTPSRKFTKAPNGMTKLSDVFGLPPISPWNYPLGPGWTAAKVKRMARKRRNQLRDRKAKR